METPPDDEKVRPYSNRIGEVRRALVPKRSQKWLAEKSGYHLGQITKLEQGWRPLTEENTGRIAAALGCDPRDLYTSPDSHATDTVSLVPPLGYDPQTNKLQPQGVTDVLFKLETLVDTMVDMRKRLDHFERKTDNRGEDFEKRLRALEARGEAQSPPQRAR